MKRIFFLIVFIATGFSYAEGFPEVRMPAEFQSGEFSEGTITHLGPNDISTFIPWAQNAKKILKNALLESQSLPTGEQIHFITREIESVVRSSETRQYQTLMRFALNRGLLLMKILEKETDPRDLGLNDNKLSILTASIGMAIELSESDVSFQQRLSGNDSSLEIGHASFGIKLNASLIGVSKNIFDASAQYQFMRKSYEMLNWDLVQDKNSKDYSELIVEIYRTLETTPDPPQNDNQAISSIKRLILLGQKISNSPNVTYGILKLKSPHLGKFSLIPAEPRKFLIMETEVTQQMWFDVMRKNPSGHSRKELCPSNYKKVDGVALCPDFPVENISYDMVVNFIEKLNSLGPHKYRLPTNLEWKKAASKNYPSEESLSDYAWFGYATGKMGPVGAKKPNPFGLFDMLGNVEEMTEDDQFPGHRSKLLVVGGSFRSLSVSSNAKGGWSTGLLQEDLDSDGYHYQSESYSGVARIFIGFRLIMIR